MAVTPNSLLQAAAQATVQAKPQAAPVSPLANAAQPDDKASSFAQLYAKESQNKPQSKPLVVADNSPKPGRDKSADYSSKKDVGSDQSAAPQSVVADSGKTLPADKPASSDSKTSGNDSKAAASDDSKPVDTAQVDTPPSVPPLDSSLVSVVPPPPVVATEAPPATPLAPQVEAAPAVVPPPVAAAVVAPVADPAKAEFDPEADPLDAMPAVRLAMEQGGHVSASSQAQPKAAPASANSDGQLASVQNFANGMASMLEQQTSKNSTEQGGEKAFTGLVAEGLKDLKGASSDTRVDDFANRLAALTQAATPKTANATPVNQPLAMHQSGWTDEVVNRVMYLSSSNLKSADIQLQPAELGRLDIRVHMIPDQQTQVTFMSAHAGVREALEGQMHRMRDMFSQQGLGQVDVNVSDQSRGWQGQEQAQQGQNRGSGSSTSGGRLDGVDDEQPHAVAEVAAPVQTVIGSSAVDYYA
ncbi:flagellar hook-length control protein FliK [Pseudomonas sp. Fl5BN2]|uniref:flagellar hook-length control protein FliK n=1 Tax=unclassified Pseudomonas TaxID=196821 RepID=UPI0013778199|nr:MULTISPECIES: flagellar hook-length control protein FliK [unclassified Pseudomonas]NBF01437.1 flagellar hook-length control protein FliK [Pseudomonas sp. Fl5BN2]NBF08327.1 flagellar hook-length control protein FliK [Pseudomonas sp. Fl4BN1]